MPKCVICNKKLSKGPFSKNKKFDLLNHDCICRGCAFRIGITNKLDAATYTAKKVRDEYIELYPTEVGLRNYKSALDNDHIITPVDGGEKVNLQKKSGRQPKPRKKRGCLTSIILCVICFTIIFVLGSVVQRDNQEELSNTVHTWISDIQENYITAVNKISENIEEKKLIEEKLDIKSDEDPVDIYHAILDFEGIGAEAYLANLREENPEKQYSYYNEEYFIETITEGERKAILEQVKDADAYFTEAFAADSPGMFIKAELDRNMDELTLHFNREVYKSNPFADFTVIISGAIYMNSLDAYNLIPPDNREMHIVCVDENGEILMDSDGLEMSGEQITDSSPNEKPSTKESETVSPVKLTDLEVGSVVEVGDLEIGLSYVKRSGTHTDAMGMNVDVALEDEVIYAFFEVHNTGDKLLDVSKSKVSAYADSTKIEEVPDYMLFEEDNIKELQSYEIDGGKYAIVPVNFEVKKGWKSVTIFYDDCSWTIDANDVTNAPYTFTTLFEHKEAFTPTSIGDTTELSKYTLQFDGIETIQQEYSWSGPWVAFKFTLNNTDSAPLDLSLVGYQMRGYLNGYLTDDASYTVDDNLDGYINIFDVDEVKPGMNARVYVAFETQDIHGQFSMAFDDGYIFHNTAWMINAEN